MGRLYTAQTSGVTLNEIRDLYELLAAAGKTIIVHGWHLYQITDVGDATEQILRIETVRGAGSVTSGSGGSTPTPQPVDDQAAAAGATVEANNTTRMAAGTGALEVLEEYGWNVRIPWTHFYTPELRPKVVPGDRWTLSVPVAPSNSLGNFGSTIWFEEV